MKINELLEKAGVKITCGCDSSCKHCGGKHTVAEVGKKCSCCGNEIKELKVDETTSAGAIASTGNGFANGGIGTLSRAGTTKKKNKKNSNNR